MLSFEVFIDRYSGNFALISHHTRRKKSSVFESWYFWHGGAVSGSKTLNPVWPPFSSRRFKGKAIVSGANLHRHFSKWKASSCLRCWLDVIYERKVRKRGENETETKVKPSGGAVARTYFLFAGEAYRIFAQLGDNVARCPSVTGISHTRAYTDTRYTHLRISQCDRASEIKRHWACRKWHTHDTFARVCAHFFRGRTRVRVCLRVCESDRVTRAGMQSHGK